MKSFLSLVVLASLAVAFPASAAVLNGGDGGDIGGAMTAILAFISGYVIPFILAIGFLMFVWGMFNYFIRGGANEEAKENGRSLIMYAIAGYVVILAFWGIVNILSNGLGLEDSLDTTPEVPTLGN
ncbi:MAG: hypothetical protein ACK4SL_02570 [Candidatus Paceibacteria bacterium]